MMDQNQIQVRLFSYYVQISMFAKKRILECEKQPGLSGGKVPVEIWDVSGDQRWVYPSATLKHSTQNTKQGGSHPTVLGVIVLQRPLC